MANPTPTLSQSLLNKIIATNEVGNVENSYLLSHAGTANSGFSVGAFQLDLAHQPEARSAVEAFLHQSGVFTSAELSAISQGLLVTGNPAAIATGLKDTINTQFASPGGKAMIDALDGTQSDALMGAIGKALSSAELNPRYARDTAFKLFSDGELFQALMGDNTNQFGPPNTFCRYIEGQVVSLGGVSLELSEQPWNFQAFANFEANYSYVKNNARGAADIRRRRTNIVNILAEQNKLGDESPASCLAIIDATYQAVG